MTMMLLAAAHDGYDNEDLHVNVVGTGRLDLTMAMLCSHSIVIIMVAYTTNSVTGS